MKLYQKYLLFTLLILISLIIYFYIQNRIEFVSKVNTVLINILDKRVEVEKEKTFNFALALSQNETLQNAIKNKKKQKCYEILNTYMTTLEMFSGFQVRAQIVTTDFNILARSWDNSDAGVNVKANRPDLKKIKQTLKPHLSFEAARRLVLIASIPIVNNKQLIGFVEVIQRFESLENYFRNFDIDIVVLSNSKYEKQTVLLKNNPRIKNMIVANNGANINHIKSLQHLDIDTLLTNGILKDEKYLYFSKKIFNSNSENIGYFILVISKQKLKLFNAFENELNSFFTYSRKDIYYSILNKDNLIDNYNPLNNSYKISENISRGKIE